MFFSVVVPTHNRPDLLQEALASVQNQSYGNFECLVINDYPAGREATEAVVAQLHDARFRAIHHAHNKGLAETRNTGIKESAGDLVAFLDDDDSWEKDFLKLHAQTHQERADIGMAYCAFYKVWQDNFRPKEFYLDQQPVGSLPQAMLQGNFYTSNGSILSFKKSCFESVGLFDASCESFEDWEMLYRVCLQFPIAAIEVPLANYKIHFKERMTTSVDKRQHAYLAAQQKHGMGAAFNPTMYSFLIMDYYRLIRDSIIINKRNKAATIFLNLLRTQRHAWMANPKITLKIALLVLLNKQAFRIFRHA